MSYVPKKDIDLTGDPTAPTPAAGDADTSLATTSFVTSAVSLASGHANTLFVPKTGATLTGALVSAVTPTASGHLTNKNYIDAGLAGKASASHTHPLSELTQSGAASGQLAAWNGSAWVPYTSGATFGLREIVSFDTSGTFVKADYPYLQQVRVRLWGAGGGSGGTAATSGTQSAVGAGGGGGGYSEQIIPVASLPASATVTVGTGGTAGATGANDGGAGGTTSFGSAFCQATGGGGGAGGNATSGTNAAVGGAGGIGSGGDINLEAADATPGNVVGGNRNTACRGGGAAGGGAEGQRLSATSIASSGQPGLVPGGGSSGGIASPSRAAQAGAVGGDGFVIVELYG